MKGLFVSIIFLFFGCQLSAQLTGTKTIPGSYATIAAAISALNASGVGTGGVTFRVSTGYTETFSSSSAGIVTATGTSSNPIVFQKSGTGTNPLITAGTGTGITDGIIVIAGGDYITFDGIDVQENPGNTNPTTQMEWGYALVKKNSSSPIDGCQYVAIGNCNITLVNTYAGSTGIHSGNHTSNSLTSLLVLSASDAMNHCEFYRNTITNCYTGISLTGYNANAPYNLYDQNNIVGSQGGNTINGFGGGTSTAYGIYCIYQNNLTIEYNTLNGGSGTTASDVYGILIATCINSNIEIYTNIMTVYSSATTQAVYGIALNTGLVTGTSNSQNIDGNTITNFQRPSVTSGEYYFISTANSAPLNLNIFSNTIHNTTTMTTGAIYGIYQTGAPVNLTCTNNEISNITRNTVTTGANVIGIYNTNSGTGGAIIFSQNSIFNLTSSGNDPGAGIYGMLLSGGETIKVSKNYLYNFSSGTTSGMATGLCLSAASTQFYVYNNMIQEMKAPASTLANAISAIKLANSTNISTMYVWYNSIYLDATSSGAGFGSSGIYASTTPPVELKNNIVVNVSTPGTGGVTCALRRSGTSMTSYDSGSNNNDFYTGSPSASKCIMYDGTNSFQTLGDFQTFVSPSENKSFSEIPPFTNISFSPYSLSLLSLYPTRCESGGTPITSPISVTDDITGDPRNATTPDVGADEYNGTPVPVELYSFSKIISLNDVVLNWETKTEINANYFSVERSTGADVWVDAGRIKAHGNSNVPVKYCFTDKHLNTAKYLYRLKTVDNDGSFRYSMVINAEVVSPMKFSMSQNYPNPFNPSTKINYQIPTDSHIKIEVFNLTGEKVAELINSEKESGYYSLDINSSLLKYPASGIYFYRMESVENNTGKKSIITNKMIFLK
jgi:hypothetical protein